MCVLATLSGMFFFTSPMFAPYTGWRSEIRPYGRRGKQDYSKVNTKRYQKRRFFHEANAEVAEYRRRNRRTRERFNDFRTRNSLSNFQKIAFISKTSGWGRIAKTIKFYKSSITNVPLPVRRTHTHTHTYAILKFLTYVVQF